MQSKSVGELVNQVGELYMKTDSNVSEFDKMKSYSEGVISSSNYDTKVSASKLKREVSGWYLSMIKSKNTKLKKPHLIRAKRSSRKNQRRFRKQEEDRKCQVE